MKVIDFNQINSLHIEPSQCYEWAEEMIKHKADTLLPPKTHLNMPDGVFCNVMPSLLYLPNGNWGGVKIVTRYPKREPALDSKIVLFNSDTGDFLAILDGNWITAMRTGAVAAHSIITLAKKNYSTMGMLGLGNTARATLLVLASRIGNKELNIKLLRYKNQAELFQKRFADYKNLHFTIVDSVKKLITGSDVVVSCATYFDHDIAKDSYFDKGVLVVPVHTRGFTNCDLFFDKIFADDTGHVQDFKNFNKFKSFAEMTEVVNGRNPGRESDDERILAYNIGVSMHDINFAAHVYEQFEQQPSKFNKLQDIDMHEPTEKFWI